MKKEAKHRRLLVLMIITQLLLTLFVVQWLRSQYQKQKLTLHTELKYLYMVSQEEALDSLILEHIVDPVLADSSVGYLEFNRKPPIYTNNSPNDTIIVKAIRSETGPARRIDNAFITIDLQHDTVHSDSLIDLNNFNRSDINEEILLRSLRLIISRSDDSTGSKEDFFWYRNSALIDSAGFMQSYQKKLEESGIKCHVEWTNLNQDGHFESSRTQILIQAGFHNILPEAVVSRYGGYLFGKLIPQILFSGLLLILTGFAFILAYRSLVSQWKLNLVKNDFISNITHELKTPVSTVKVIIEALRKFDLKNEMDQAVDYLNVAAQETRRLEGLINRVLDQSFMEESEQPVQLSDFDPAELIREVIDSQKPRLDAESATINLVDSSNGVTMTGDRLYIQGVLTNLIDNSLKYSAGNSIIEISMEKEGSFLNIRIRDNGPGIPEKYQKRIFEKFFRIPSGNVHNVKGYGLGLTFAALVMEMHGGTIDVKNLNEGCIFTLKFPVKQGD